MVQIDPEFKSTVSPMAGALRNGGNLKGGLNRMAQGTKSGGVITLRRHINCGNPGHTEVLTTLITQWPRTWWSSLIGLVTVKNLPATSDTTRRLRRTEMSGRGSFPTVVITGPTARLLRPFSGPW